MGKLKASFSGQLADADLKLLRVFKVVTECRGVSAAVDDLNIAAPTISNYLADLEKRLDVRLCQRGRKGFALTEDGEMVYSAVQELLGAVEQFQNRVRGNKQHLIGTLPLGIAESTAQYHCSPLSEAFYRFTRQAPDVYVDLHTLMDEEVVRAVLDDRLAVGISYLDKPDPALELQPLFQEHSFLYCSKAHPFFQEKDSELSINEIEQQKFIETPRLKRGLKLGQEHERWHFQARTPSMEARALLIQSGNFLGYLPREYIELIGLKDQLRPLLPERFHYTNQFYVMTRKGAYLSPVVQRFLDCIEETA